MISTRYFFLFGLVLFVDAVSILPTAQPDEWDLDDVAAEFFDTYEVGSLRVRRDADEKETTDRESNSAEGPGPRPVSGECLCPAPHPGSHGPHSCVGLSRAECREKMTPPPYSGPPCQLRLLYSLPTEFNHTARKMCFEMWEKPALEEKGIDFSKRPSKQMMRFLSHRNLMVNKGCNAQCMFLQRQLVVAEGDDWTISKEAVMEALKEEDDPQEMTDIFEELINKCMEEASELIHQKQSCKSGSDEFLACLKLNLNKACPGSKWKGNKSCTDVEDANRLMRNCRQEQRSKFTHGFRGGMTSGF